MYSRKERLKKLGMDLVLLLIGLAIVSAVLYACQTHSTLKRQRENAQVKFDTAKEKITANQQVAEEYQARYDAFNQAKTDSLAYFYSENPDKMKDMQAMAEQWELSALYVVNNQREILYTTSILHPDFQSEDFNAEFYADTAADQTDGVVAIDELRYYTSVIADDLTLVTAKNSHKADTYVKNLNSPAKALSTMRVGSTGHIEAINIEEETIEYDPEIANIGKTVREAGFECNTFSDGYEGWINYNGERYFAKCESLDKDTVLLTMVPNKEISSTNIKMVSLADLVYVILMLIIIIYIHLVRVDQAEQKNPKDKIEYIRIYKDFYFNKTIWKSVKRFLIIGIVMVVLISFYVQTLGALSQQSVRSEEKQADIEYVFKENKERLKEVKEEYNKEYAGRAENIAYLIQQDPRLAADDKLEVLAKEAQIKLIYVFNHEGQVISTNGMNKDYILSTDEKDASYEFWSIIEGYVDSLVQGVTKIEKSNDMYQFIGVKRKDAEGMVQIAVSPQRLENRLKMVEPSYILGNIGVENGGYLIGLDQKTKKITFSDDTDQIDQKGTSLGLSKAAMQDGYSGYQTVNSQSSFVTTNVHNDTIICMVVPLTKIENGRILLTVIVSVMSLLMILVIVGLSLVENMKTIQKAKKEEEEITVSENQSIVEISSRISGEVKRVQTATSRFDSHRKIPWKECNADERIVKILNVITGIVGLALVAYVMIEKDHYDKTSILSYIVHKKWEYVPNIFSLSYIAIVMLEVVVVTTIIRKLVMLIATNLGAKTETIGRLLESFMKYLAIIGGVFYSMNFIGVDSTTLLASAGLLSVVVGLGAQSMISDILAGIFIVFEGEFRVGDIIEIETWRGTVLDIGIRTTKVEDLSGNIKVFNNSKITGVVNLTKKNSYAFCDVGIEYEESIEHVEHILKDALPQIKKKLPEIEDGPYYKGIVTLADSSVVIRIVAQCQESDRIQLSRDLNREMKLLFDKNNIGIAYPQVVVHQPTVHQKASHKDIRDSENFVKEQKEGASHIQSND